MYPTPHGCFYGTVHLPLTATERDEAIDKAFAERAAAQAAVAKVVTPPATPSVPPPDGKATDAATNGAVSTAPGADVSKAPAPDWRTTVDLSALPEKVRSQVHFDSEEAYVAWKVRLEHEAASQERFRQAAAKRDEAEALKRDADNYRALVSDPKKAKKVAKLVMGEDEPEVPDAPVDMTDPDAAKAELDRREAAAVEKAKAALQAEQARPAQLRDQVNAAIGDFVAKTGTPQDVAIEAVKLAHAYLTSKGKAWNLDTAEDLVASYVEVVKAKRAATPPPAAPSNLPPANGHAGLAEVASPVGRGGAHEQQFVPFPSYYVNGEPPKRPRTAEEWTEEDLYRQRLRFGPNVTIEDLRAASRSR